MSRKRPRTAPKKPQNAARQGSRQAPETGQLRIIGGQWRSRKLSFPAVDGLRPTGDRWRETLFNWLAPVIPGARCLDAFAGSGALGLEALSRGAAQCCFIEANPQAARALQSNMTLLSADGGRLIAQPAETALTTINERFDIVFLDPPFAMTIDELIEKIDGICSDQALIYYEKSPNMPFSAPAHWQLEKHKQSGQIDACLYRVKRIPLKG